MAMETPVTDAIHTTATAPETTHGLLLTDNSRLVLTKSSTLFAGNGSNTTPSICFTTTSDGFFHDGNGINLMVNNVHDFLFKNGGEFHADADVIAFSTTISDEKLKNDVKTIDFTDKVKKLRGVEYTWNKGGRKGQKDLGVIAQEVEKVIPEVVRDKEMPLMDDSGETYKTVDYEKLTAVLIEGMKEQQKQINELKEEVKELKKKVPASGNQLSLRGIRRELETNNYSATNTYPIFFKRFMRWNGGYNKYR